MGKSWRENLQHRLQTSCNTMVWYHTMSCNFWENHGLGVTRSHAWVLGDKEMIEISPFLRLGLTWVCSVVTRVFLVVHTGVT